MIEPVNIRLDPELGRLSITLKQAHFLRVWCVLRHVVRNRDGSGKVNRREIPKTLKQFGIKHSRRHINRIIQQGEGIYWNATPTLLYIRSSSHVAKMLTQMALEVYPDGVSTNKPGVRDVLLDPKGTLEEWEAQIYKGWLTHRENPTISREVLSILFNRTPETLRRWEQVRLGDQVIIRSNYAQQTDDEWTIDKHFHHIPEHAVVYARKTKHQNKFGFRWRISNTYKTRYCRQHPHKGQASKVRRAVNRVLEQPANQRRGGLPVRKLYFETAKSLRAYLDKHEGVYQLWRGENKQGHGIFEVNSEGYAQTKANERLNYKHERVVFETKKRWLERGDYCGVVSPR